MRLTDDPVQLARILQGDAIKLSGESAHCASVAQLLEGRVRDGDTILEGTDYEFDDG